MIYEVTQHVSVVWKHKRVVLAVGDLAVANEDAEKLNGIDRGDRRVAVMEFDQLSYARRASPEAFEEFQPGKKEDVAKAEAREIEEPAKDRQVKAAARSRSKKGGGAK